MVLHAFIANHPPRQMVTYWCWVAGGTLPHRRHCNSSNAFRAADCVVSRNPSGGHSVLVPFRVGRRPTRGDRTTNSQPALSDSVSLLLLLSVTVCVCVCSRRMQRGNE